MASLGVTKDKVRRLVAKAPAKPKKKTLVAVEATEEEIKHLNEIAEIYKEFTKKANPYVVARYSSVEKLGWKNITLGGNPTGCGLGVLYGVTNLRPENKELIKQIKSDSKDAGYGVVFCTLGDAYYRYNEPILLGLGFEELIKYTNHRHGAPSTQKMYILRIK